MLVVKEEMIGGEKWLRAAKLGGSDALVMWFALKCYCSRHPDTEGFIPDEVLDGLPGAPRRPRKALAALLDCGRLLPGGKRGPGLVEAAEHGWRLHDYLDHAGAPEDEELRRTKQRIRKQTYREGKRRELALLHRFAGELTEGGQPRGQPGDSERDTEGTPSGTPGGDSGRDTPTPARPREGAPAPGPARSRARPNPSQPSPPKLKSPVLQTGILLEPGAHHHRFAEDYGVDLERVVAEMRGDPALAALPPAEVDARLSARLVSAAGAERVGGAA